MKKQIAVIIIASVIILTVVVLALVWDKKATVNEVAAPPVAEKNSSVDTNNETGRTTAKPADGDVSAIEGDLNSVSDDSFGENGLADSEMGL